MTNKKLAAAAILAALIGGAGGMSPSFAQQGGSQAQLEREATKLYERAWKLHDQGKYAEAIPMAERALAIRERVHNKDHPDTLVSVNSLGVLYANEGRYGEAEPLFKRALEARERTLGKDHPDTLTSVNNLGVLYVDQGRYGEAEPLLQARPGGHESARSARTIPTR